MLNEIVQYNKSGYVAVVRERGRGGERFMIEPRAIVLLSMSTDFLLWGSLGQCTHTPLPIG